MLRLCFLAAGRLGLIALKHLDLFLVSSPSSVVQFRQKKRYRGPQTFIFRRRRSLVRMGTSLAVRMRTELIRGSSANAWLCS
jgi:hypothetical protein